MLEVRKQKNKPFRAGGMAIGDATATDVFNWWMEYDILPGQYNLFEDYDDDEEVSE